MWSQTFGPQCIRFSLGYCSDLRLPHVLLAFKRSTGRAFFASMLQQNTSVCDCRVNNGGYSDRHTQKQTQLIFFSASIEASNEKKIFLARSLPHSKSQISHAQFFQFLVPFSHIINTAILIHTKPCLILIPAFLSFILNFLSSIFSPAVL